MSGVWGFDSHSRTRQGFGGLGLRVVHMIIWFPLELVPWLYAPHRLPPRPIFGTMAAFKDFGVLVMAAMTSHTVKRLQLRQDTPSTLQAYQHVAQCPAQTKTKPNTETISPLRVCYAPTTMCSEISVGSSPARASPSAPVIRLLGD